MDILTRVNFSNHEHRISFHLARLPQAAASKRMNIYSLWEGECKPYWPPEPGYCKTWAQTHMEAFLGDTSVLEKDMESTQMVHSQPYSA